MSAPMTLHCRHYRSQWTRGNDVSSESRVTRKKVTDSLLYVFCAQRRQINIVVVLKMYQKGVKVLLTTYRR